MTTSLLTGVAGLVLLYVGGEGLVRGSCSLALRLRVSPLVVGLTIVAFGTSAPELVVSVSAALGGADDIAVGNVVGSNIANLALILGAAALLRSAAVEAKLLRVDAPLMVLISLGCVALLGNDDRLTRPEGSLLLVGLLAYGVYTFVQGRRETEAVKEEFVSVASRTPGRKGKDLLQIALGSVALMVGGNWLVGAAVDVAGSLGVNQAVVGLTIVAVGTSLPELATSMIATSKGHGDIAVGNVIGSNIFNLLGVLGITSVVTPLSRGHVGWASLGVMLGVTILVLPMLYSRRRLSKWEGGILLACYVGYLGWLLAGELPRPALATTTATTADSVIAQDPYLVVLGIAQDGGVPQAGTKEHAGWDDSTARRQVVSLALIDPESSERWLFEATPDLREQLHRLDTVFPVAGKPGLAGVFLTHAHMGHYTGLMFFGHESMGASAVPVYAMPAMREYLSTNGPWDQLVRYRNIELMELADETPVRLNGRLVVTPFLVPHRQEYTEVVGYRIDGPSRSVLFIPDIDSWEEFDRAGTRIEDLIAGVDVAYLDASFFANGEIPGRDMSGFPHPFITHSMDRFADLVAGERTKVRFIHLNHTNPALRADSEARRTIRRNGFRVAEEMERVGL